MRTPELLRLVAFMTVLVLLSLGGCSDSPTEPPQATSDDTETPAGPEITVLEDLSLSRQSLLVDQSADLVARIKAEAPTPYAITSVSLHELDTDGESLVQLSVLLDDGESASADMVENDKIYSGQATGLLYADPDTLDIAVRIIAEADGEEDLVLWSEVAPLPVLRTDLVFLAGPRAYPQGITTAVNTDLRVVAELGLADSLSLRGVDLYRVTALGDSVLFLGPMADNGNLDNGDEIMSDGNYTGIMKNMFVVAPQTIFVKALATAFSEESGLTHLAWSPTLDVPVEYPPTLGLVEAALANQDSVETLWQQYLDIDMEPATAKDSLLAWLDRQDHILDNYLSPDGGTLWTVYFNGFEAGVVLGVEGAPLTYGTSRPHRSPAETAHLMSVGTPAARRPASALGDRNPEIPDEVDSNLALVYSPFHSWVDSQPGQEDPAVAVVAAFEDAHCPSFGVTDLRDEAADMATLKQLYRYGAISIFTHGVQLAGGQTAMLTGETVNYQRCVTNAWDLFTFDPAACIVRLNGESHFAVKPDFFSKYTPHFPNSIVQITACYSAVNNMLPLAFTGQGAGFFTGYDGSVSLGFAAESSVAFWSNLLESGDRSGPAHENVAPQVDPGHEGAAFVSQGNPDLFFGTDLQNGGFELGSLAAWDKAGDGRVISRLDDQLPVDGNAMGIISTGLGYTESTGEVTQVVCVPAGADWLRFSYNFFSEEFLEWCGSGFQDFFRVSVIDESENETELFYIQIDQMCDDVTPANIQFDQGPSGDDNGVYRTGWRDLDLGITPWAGQTVTLRFAAGDIGDSIFDSAILIDAIRIE